MINKDKYREFCNSEPNMPIFSQYWWLDAVCGEENWDVSVVEKGGHIVATMPFYYKKRTIFNIITMPRLTQTLGPYIKYPQNQKYYKKIALEKEVINKLILQLPKFDYFIQNLSPAITNWQPFYWNNFQQTTSYTYIIENMSLSDLDKNIENDVRRRNKKSRELGVIVVESDDIDNLYELNRLSYERQNMNIPYEKELVRKVYDICKGKNTSKLYMAMYKDKPIATGFFIFDSNSVYYLMGGVDPESMSLGAMDLILYNAIEFAIETGRKFDFEGTMVQSIEKYFRSFGAKQKSIIQIKKVNSPLLKIRELLKSW